MMIDSSTKVPELTIDPFDKDFLADPFKVHPRLRDAGPLCFLPAIGCYTMARYGEVQAAPKDWETFVSGRGVGLADFSREAPLRPPSLLLETDPPMHDRTHGLMNRIASLGALHTIMPEWQAKADTLVASFTKKGAFDAVPNLAEAFPLSVFHDLIGLREKGRENLIPYATVAFNAFGPRNALLEESMEAARDVAVWVAESCKRDMRRPGGWGMQVYEAADRGDCTHDEAERLVRSFLTAGVDITVNGIATLVHAFAEFPDQYQKGARRTRPPEKGGRGSATMGRHGADLFSHDLPSRRNLRRNYRRRRQGAPLSCRRQSRPAQIGRSGQVRHHAPGQRPCRLRFRHSPAPGPDGRAHGSGSRRHGPADPRGGNPCNGSGSTSAQQYPSCDRRIAGRTDPCLKEASHV